MIYDQTGLNWILGDVLPKWVLLATIINFFYHVATQRYDDNAPYLLWTPGYVMKAFAGARWLKNPDALRNLDGHRVVFDWAVILCPLLKFSPIFWLPFAFIDVALVLGAVMIADKERDYRKIIAQFRKGRK